MDISSSSSEGMSEYDGTKIGDMLRELKNISSSRILSEEAIEQKIFNMRFDIREGEDAQELISRQLQLEDKGFEIGIERYREMQQEAVEDHQVSTTEAGRKLIINELLPNLKKAIEEEREKIRNQKVKGKRLSKNKKPLFSLPADKLAFITIRHVLNSCVHKETAKLTSLATELSNLIEHEIAFHKLDAKARMREKCDERDNARLINVLHRSIRKRYGNESSRLYLNHKLNQIDIDSKSLWSVTPKPAFGALLIALLLESTKAFEHDKLPTDLNDDWIKEVHIIKLTEETQKRLEDPEACAKDARPFLAPMVCRPTPWKALYGGGYLSIRTSLIKKAYEEHRLLLKKADLRIVYKTLNLLQTTSWRINPRIYDLLATCQKTDNYLGKIPEKIPEEPQPDEKQKVPENEDKEAKKKGLSGFRAEEFKGHYTIEALCNSLRKDGFVVAENTIPEMNKLLNQPDLYGKMASKVKDAASKGFEKLQKAYEKNNSNEKLERLNRIAIEECYPQEAPELKKRKQEERAAKYSNFKRKAKRTQFDGKLAIAKEFLNYDKIYFPYALDWRGRIYPLSQNLHPQADDIGKALLQFAEGKPLGESGERWLRIHLANCYGKDKDSFDYRCQWVDDNEDEINKSVKDPLKENSWWTKAKKPWSFLAACFEWKGYRDQRENWKSHIPIFMDGTCNGLQHYSALGKDLRGGEATNLIGGAKPSDIYTEVLLSVQSRIDNQSEEAVYWKKYLDRGRGLVKACVMTISYGIGEDGLMDEIEDYMDKEYKERPSKESTGYLAGLIRKAVDRVVTSAPKYMKWLRDIATALSDIESSSGFRVEEFKGSYTIEALSNSLRKDGFLIAENTISELNKLLKQADLYCKVAAKMKDDVSKGFEKLQKAYEKNNSNEKLERLNRIAIEECYPKETPKVEIGKPIIWKTPAGFIVRQGYFC